jgi:hypothetical protein
LTHYLTFASKDDLGIALFGASRGVRPWLYGRTAENKNIPFYRMRPGNAIFYLR